MLECILCLCFIIISICYMIITYKNIQYLEAGSQSYLELYSVLHRKIELEADKLRLEIKCKMDN